MWRVPTTSKRCCPAMSYRDANHLKSTFQRELWSEAGTWLLERTQTLWNAGMPDEASALYSEFSRGPALSERLCSHLIQSSASRKHKCLLGGVRPVASHESEEPRRSNTPGSFLGKRSLHPQQSCLIGEGGGRLASSRQAALSVSEGAIGIPLLFLCP